MHSFSVTLKITKPNAYIRDFSYHSLSSFKTKTEIGLLMNERRQGSVKATTVSFVFCLSREDLNTVLNQFPTLRASLEARARERLQELYLSENRPLETIMALFSDPDLDSTSAVSETESEITDSILNMQYAESENTAARLYKYPSSVIDALAAAAEKDEMQSTPQSITPPSTATYTAKSLTHLS